MRASNPTSVGNNSKACTWVQESFLRKGTPVEFRKVNSVCSSARFASVLSTEQSSTLEFTSNPPPSSRLRRPAIPLHPISINHLASVDSCPSAEEWRLCQKLPLVRELATYNKHLLHTRLLQNFWVLNEHIVKAVSTRSD